MYLLSKYLVLQQTVYLVCVQREDHIWLQFINCSLLLVLTCNMLKFRHADGEAFSVVRFFCLHLIPSILRLCLLLVDKAFSLTQHGFLGGKYPRFQALSFSPSPSLLHMSLGPSLDGEVPPVDV